jgi:hypothetical protein
MSDRIPERPRGLAVWAGLDAFGEQALAPLRRWVGESSPAPELAEANRLLPRLTIPEEGGGPAAAAIVSAIGELLASPLRARALDYSDRDVLVIHVWLIGDTQSEETGRLASWLAGFFREMAWRQVEVRVFLVFRNRSWSQPPEAQAEVARRFEALTNDVIARDKPGDGATLVFVVNDRDGIGGRDTDVQTEQTVVQMLEFALLSDAAHRPIAEAGTAFSPPNLPPVGGWDTIPAFASFATEASRWEAESLNAAAAAHRLGQLRDALEQSSPAGWDPRPPALQQDDLARTLHWRELDLPKWAPRFMAAPIEEYAGLRARIDEWLVKATSWRHDMLVTFEDNRIRIQHTAERSIIDYMADLDGRIRGVLREDAVPGLFSPLKRLLDRSQADLQVRRVDLRQNEPTQEAGEFPTPEDSALPRAELADADESVATAIERKINPMMLVQVAALTGLMGWIWLALSASAGTAFWPVLALIEAIAHLVARVPFLPDELQLTLASIDLTRPLTTNLDLSNVAGHTWLYSGLGLLLPLIAVTVFTAIRQRVKIERAYLVFYRRAAAWRDGLAGDLPTILEVFEYERSVENLMEASMEVSDRADRLEALRLAGVRPIIDKPEPDAFLTRAIIPEAAGLSPLSDQQVEQILRAIRQHCVEDLRFGGDHRAVWQCMYREAARVAGDQVPALREELPSLISDLKRHAPQPGAIKVRQFGGAMRPGFADPRLTSFTGVPAGIAHDLAGRIDSTLLPLPTPDRFYQVIIQTGISPQWALALPSKPEPGEERPWFEQFADGAAPGSGAEPGVHEPAGDPAADDPGGSDRAAGESPGGEE